MTRAPVVPEFPPDGAPVSFLVDYDGTISRVDVTDTLLSSLTDDPELAQKDLDYSEGRIGSRELAEWDLTVLPHNPDVLRLTAELLPLDRTFPEFVAAVRRRRAAVEIVSDGLGFYVAPGLARLGVADLPVATNAAELHPISPRMRFPYGHPRCFVCGTCKRERVRGHQRARRAVVFVGDGTSDRFAAAHADVVFAKDDLARLCEAEGWPYRAWESFADVTAWVDSAFNEGTLPTCAADYDAWRARFAPAPRPFICGPEVWGPDRRTPGGGPGVAA